MATPVLQFKRGSATNIGIASFKSGEPGFTTDKYDFYIGLDGTQSNQKFFGSARYWSRETGAASAILKLVDQNGSNSINLRAPLSLSGITTYTFPATASAGNFLRVAADGTLTWETVATTSSFTDATLSGLSTISDFLNITANTNVSGFATFSQTITGTISTATNARNIDITQTTSSDATTSIVLVGNQATGFQTAFIDSGLTYDSSTDALTVAGNLNVNGGTVATSSGTGTIFASPTTLNFGSAATALVIGNTSGIATINNATLSLPNATTVNVNGASPTFASSSTGTLTFFNTNLTAVNAFGNATSILLGAATGITTVRNSLRVTNALYDTNNSAGTNGQILTSTGSGTGIGWTTILSATLTGTISTATRATTADVTATNSQSGGLLFATAGNGATHYNDADLTYDSSTNILSGSILSATTEVRTGALKSADGTAAITIANGTGAVITNSDFTVGGNLFVNGSTTQVNTSELQVYDRTITLGIQSGTTASTTTWDLGILMNYGDAGTAKTSGVIWESTNKRFQFALSANNPSAGVDVNNPQITVSAGSFAPIEIAALWVNDTAGISSVVSYQALNGLYTGSPADRYLQNVTVDAGIF